MEGLEGLLRKSVKLSCIDEEKLLRRKAGFDDALELLTTLRNDVRSRSQSQDLVNAVGVVVIVTSMVSDILRDTAGQVASKPRQNFLLKLGLEKIYDKARSSKWKGNKYEKTIDAIRKNSSYLENLVDGVGGSNAPLLKMLVVVHRNMAANMVGLVGHMEDSAEIKQMLARSLAALEKDIRKAAQASEQLKFYLETGEGAASPGDRMSRPPAPKTPPAPPRLG